MKVSTNFDTIKSGWFIVPGYVFVFEVGFRLANSADPDKIAAFHLGFH